MAKTAMGKKLHLFFFKQYNSRYFLRALSTPGALLSVPKV